MLPGSVITRLLFPRKPKDKKQPCANYNDKDVIASVAILKDCGKKKDLRKGSIIHANVQKKGFLETNPYVGSALISMYAKCGAMQKAQEVLDELHVRDIVSWNALISGYVQHGKAENAFDCFECMQNDGIFPDGITFSSILKACANIGSLELGKRIHNDVLCRGLLTKDALLGTTIVDMYVKCGKLEGAQAVFDGLPMRDAVSWSVLIARYVEKGHNEEAFACYEEMQSESLSPDAITFTCILKACGNMRATEKGKRIHDEIIKKGFLSKDTILGTALVDMYAKCGSMIKAQEVFDQLVAQNVVSWNTLIAGYGQQGEINKVLNSFRLMQHNGVFPDVITFISILEACGDGCALGIGKQVHDYIARIGLHEKHIELGNALVDMYAKCNALAKAQQMLNVLPTRDVVTWNTLIGMYAQHMQCEDALSSFTKMRNDGISPNAITYICILKVCGSMGAIHRGNQLHNEIISHGLIEKHYLIGNALVDMYAKCGDLGKAQVLFEKLLVRGTVSWNILIAGYAQEGRGEKALDCFEQMQAEGLVPDVVTYICVLRACSHSCLLKEGQEYFANIRNIYGLIPNVHHHLCMVYLFSRAGRFDNAIKEMAKISSFKYSILCAFLSACQKWGNAKLARLAFENVTY